ncbi:MAG: hypothetical protein IPN39_06910 [Chitinophagaceae bacterium]|nr:hypothetical protein [Chitinophagaceae bacterium]HQX74015.1 hypothetical protein [Chitinophagaceae bacterium]
MEVHHHSHTARKKWTHYFWEFLMLFLAVFCGFLAENQREHMIEHQREKKFIRSLISDLSADTNRLGTIIKLRNETAVMLDSFMVLLNKPDAEKFSRTIYYFNSYATRGVAFRFTAADGTMQQLKNGGNLRLIRKASVSDSIIAYDVVNRGYVWGGQDEEEIMDTYRNIAENVFDGRILNAMRDENNNVSMPDYDPPFRKTADAVFRLNYRIHMLSIYNKTLRYQARSLKENAVKLIIQLKKEYKLK